MNDRVVCVMSVGADVYKRQVPAGAFDAEQNLKGTAVLDRLFAGALEHAGKIEAEGAAAKQGNVKVNLHRLVVEILESVKPGVEVIVLPVSAEPYGF